jgi:hypothetical protein
MGRATTAAPAPFNAFRRETLCFDTKALPDAAPHHPDPSSLRQSIASSALTAQQALQTRDMRY